MWNLTRLIPGGSALLPLIALLALYILYQHTTTKLESEVVSLKASIAAKDNQIRSLNTNLAIMQSRAYARETIETVPDDTLIDFMRERGYLRTEPQRIGLPRVEGVEGFLELQHGRPSGHSGAKLIH